MGLYAAGSLSKESAHAVQGSGVPHTPNFRLNPLYTLFTTYSGISTLLRFDF
jgi:hypothetical protein